MPNRLPIAAALALLCQQAIAQVSTRPEIEISHAPQRLYALTNARVIVSAADIRSDVTLVIDAGRVREILPAGRAAPAGAAVIDVMGKTIRAAFIDLASTALSDSALACASSSNIGFVPPAAPSGSGVAGEPPAVAQAGGHWNKMICPERRVAAALVFDEAKLAALRKLGFGYVLSHGADGVLRGTSALVSLRASGSAQQNLIASDVTSDAAIVQSGDFSGSYPTSYMGAIALLRQAFIDARWQHRRLGQIADGQVLERPEANRALDALTPAALGQQPVMLFARNELDLARAQGLADENKLKLISVGSGFEYRVVNSLNLATPLVLPLNFPAAPEIDDPEKALDVSLAELEHWQYAPFNPRIVSEHKIRFALSAVGMETPEANFAPNLRKAIRYGLSEANALAALTEVPAAMINMPQMGTLKPGSLASFSISDDNFFTDDEAKIYEMWVDGSREIIVPLDAAALEGRWRFTSGTNNALELIIANDGASFPLAANATDAEKAEAPKISMTREGARVLLQFPKTAVASLSDAPANAALSVDLTLAETDREDTEGKDTERKSGRLNGRWLDARGVAHPVSLERIGDLVPDANAKPQAVAAAEPGAPAGQTVVGEPGAPAGQVEPAPVGEPVTASKQIEQAPVGAPAGQGEQGAPAGQNAPVRQADATQGRSEIPAETIPTGAQVIPASTTAAAEQIAAVPSLPSAWRYPAGEFGRNALAPQSSVLFKNVTAWITGKNAPEANVDVLIENGRIKAIGAALKVANSTQVIDGTGKHLTPGIIDAHTHIASSGNVNEGSHAVTSEVRVGDIIDPTDINIYRELAGGTTTSQILHGSANPIGGQSQVIKHRWGASAQGLKFADVLPTIKFALGENPKQANWGDAYQSRYPQSRMGVEAVIRAQFTQARAYGAALKADATTRRDLRLEPLLEILAGKRLVHIHSYRADEILMFARLSTEFGFKIGAYQHVLEGYKVAKEINEVGAGASTFADWWAYKVEVIDGIPNNAAMMLRQGVNVSLNSDSQDLGRRLNTEAAKAVRYGNLSETEALQLVTLNPAKQLRIDAEVGSIEVGKSADLVLWNHAPLSTMARVDTVWIDGRVYFDRIAEQAELTRIETARAKLVQAALPERLAALAAPAQPSGARSLRLDVALQWHTNKHWPSIWMAKRGLYHNGEATHFCTDGE